MSVWDPLRELERLRREMDRIFEGAAPARNWTLGFLPGMGARQYPRVNVAEVGDDFVVEALAPGVAPESLEVTVKENVLTISGEKQAPEGVRAEAYHRSERSAGKFVRSVELPTELSQDKVKAAYADGILRVTLPKAEKVKPRRIDIQVS